MNKNILIGFLVVLVLLVSGVYLSKSSSTTDVQNIPNPVTPETPTPTPNPAVKPDAPVVETSTNPAVSSSTAVVSGKVKPNGANTSYWFEYGESTALGSRTTTQQIGSGYSLIATPAYITGLKANTTYYFRLSAKNSFATVNGTTFNFQTNNTPPVAAAVPKVNTDNATNVSRVSASLNGRVNPGGFMANYWFEYGKDNNFGNTTTFQSLDNGSALVSVSASVLGLDPLTKYYFRLNAQNQYGTVNGATLNFVTTGPAAPMSPSVSTSPASNITNAGARLNGSINTNGAATNYWFEYSQDTLLNNLLPNNSTIQTLSAGNSKENVVQDISSLVKNTRYYYRLVGRNSYGTIYGSIVSFKTKS